MIDDSFIWRLCEITVWRCMIGAYLGVYSRTSLREVDSNL